MHAKCMLRSTSAAGPAPGPKSTPNRPRHALSGTDSGDSSVIWKLGPPEIIVILDDIMYLYMISYWQDDIAHYDSM
jgi:hypothetical protein